MQFTKMQGLGNDFVVIDGVSEPRELSRERVRFLADRRFGVGCDQVLLAEPPHRGDADFRYRIFNADGGEVEHCGNGVRCLARFLTDRGLTLKRELRIETVNGLVGVRLCDDGPVAVDMGPPILDPPAIPFHAAEQALHYPLVVGDRTVSIAALSMGNPHAVLDVDSVDTAPVTELGALIEAHADFPRQVNVGFMEVVDAGHIRLRVYERGVGETLACGTGACAAVVAGRLHDRLDAQVSVALTGGRLVIHWDGGSSPVWMTGPAVTVYTGEIA